MKDLEARVAALEARNQKVESDKLWEQSLTRRLSIAIMTYIVVAVYLFMIDNSQPLINALVPALAYLLSTLALNTIRSIWRK